PVCCIITPLGIADGTGQVMLGICGWPVVPERNRIATAPAGMPCAALKAPYVSPGPTPCGMRVKLSTGNELAPYSTVMCAGVFHVFATNTAKHTFGQMLCMKVAWYSQPTDCWLSTATSQAFLQVPVAGSQPSVPMHVSITLPWQSITECRSGEHGVPQPPPWPLPPGPGPTM